ncbi:MAG TPA: hypothetical protein VKK81_26840 [Candidatus Binatia bacterium]|nr:hypothetical protein [Candidatus Binatia bacterium]
MEKVLWQELTEGSSCHKRQDGLRLLAERYGGFTPGVDIKELKEMKAVLAELS